MTTSSAARITSTARNHVASPPTHRTGVRLLGVAGATLAALVVWIVAVPLLAIDLVVRPGGGSPQTVSAASVIASSLVASLLGWGLLAAIERRTSKARAMWTRVAMVVLLLSLGAPVTAGMSTSATAVLELMHLAVAAVLIPTLRRSSSAARPSAAL